MNADPGLRITRLQDFPFAFGGGVSVPTAGMIPPGRRVHGVEFVLDCDITQPGAGQAAQLGAVLPQLIANVNQGRRVNVTGLALHFLEWSLSGRSASLPPGFPATAGVVFSRQVKWWLKWSDFNARSPNDGAIPSELFTDTLNVRFGPNTIFAATVPTITGTLRTLVHHGPAPVVAGEDVIIPTSLLIMSDPFAALQAQIQKPGVWVQAVLFREASNDNGSVTNVQVSNVETIIDGEQVVTGLRASDAASLWNQRMADGSSYRVESQTLPIGGELIQDQPGAAAAAGAGVVVDYVPLLVQQRGYNLSQLPEAKIGALYRFTGTLGAYSIAYRIAEPRPDGSIGKAAARMGLLAAHVRVKSGGSSPASRRMSRYTPLRVTRAQ